MKLLIIDKLMIDDEIDDELKEILMQLGYNINEKLIYRGIKVYNQDTIPKYTNEMVANEICNIIRKNLARESEGDTRTEEQQITYNQLTCWFIKYNQNAKRWFADIYEKQHLLTKPEETVRRLKLANDVENIMERNGIDFKILNEIVDRSGQLLQMIENGEEGVSPELRELLKHLSKNSFCPVLSIYSIVFSGFSKIVINFGIVIVFSGHTSPQCETSCIFGTLFLANL